MRTRASLAPIASIFLAAACATPSVPPVAVQPVAPSGSERVQVDQSLLIVDASNSISKREEFPKEKALLQSLVASMPAGDYEAGSIAFGGFDRAVVPLGPLDRAELDSYASDMPYLNEGSPLYAALAEAGVALEGKSGNAAITVVTDGLPSDPVGRDVPGGLTLETARQVSEAYSGTLCIHTVQIGADPAGMTFLQQLSKVTGCGSYRPADSLSTAAALQGFQREVYLGAAPVTPAPPVARVVPGDSDGDGVRDDVDVCPGTPSGASVDSRGCWVIAGLNFETNSAEMEAASRERLQKTVVPVLRSAPGVRVRIDGHSDSRGDAAYNQQLSQRRADSVRKYLIAQGIAGDRLEVRGFGETQPIAPNDTPANLRKNRRTELTVLDQ